MAPPRPRVFLSYRRQDAAGHAGRISDRLVALLGDDRVFMDVADIRPGQNFETAIEETLAGCTHVLVIVGPQWLPLLRSREATEDLVHREVAAALRRGATVVPVLVGGATMPGRDDLPADLEAFSRCQAVEIRDARFDDDVARLAAGIGAVAEPGRSKRSVLLALGLLAVAAAGGTWLFTQSRRDPPTVTGEWIAEMQKTGQPVYRIRLRLVQSGPTLAGEVRYPTGDAPIVESTVDGARFMFTTSHTPQFADAPARIRFVAELVDDALTLTSTDDAGVATGRATRATPPAEGAAPPNGGGSLGK